MRSLHVLFLFLLPTILFAQTSTSSDFTISTGNAYSYIEGYYKESFPDGKGNILSIKYASQKVTIQLTEIESMKEISRKEYTDFPPDSPVQRIIKISNKIFYFYGQLNKTRTRSLYAREITTDGLLLEPVLLFETKGETRFIELNTSADQSKILIHYKRTTTQKIDNLSYDILGFYSVDSNLKNLSGGEVTMPYTEKKMNNAGFTIGKNGTAYMLAFINGSENIELFVIKGETILKKIKLGISGILFIQALTMYENAEGNIVCTGYYANGIEYQADVFNGTMISHTSVNGLMRFKLSVDGTIVEKHQYEFPIELINQYDSKHAKSVNDGREKDGKAGIKDLKLVNAVENKDSTTLVIGEESYMESMLLSNKNIILTKLDKNGNLLWMIKLPKKQINAIGFKYIQIENYYYLIFMDTNKNLNLAPEAYEAYKAESDSYVAYYKIDIETGNFSKHKIANVADLGGIEAVQIYPAHLFEATDKIFMLETSSLKLKQSKMLKIAFKK